MHCAGRNEGESLARVKPKTTKKEKVQNNCKTYHYIHLEYWLYTFKKPNIRLVYF